MDALNSILCSLEKGIARLPRNKKALCVAVSGGQDSVVLLHCLRLLWKKKSFPFSLAILHVDHGLRGEESRKDALFVQEIAKQHSIPMELHSLSWEHGESRSQDRCRQKRYEIFQRYCASGNILALAHHIEDQAETILQRLTRGTGLRGLRCMGAWDKDRSIWRPFLGIERAQIRVVAQAEKLSWREDSTNQSLKYERNWIRQKILPLLESRRPGVAKRLAGLAKEASEIPLISNEIKPIFLGDTCSMLYSQPQLLQASSYDLVELFACERKHVLSLRELLQKTHGALCLPQGKACFLSQGWLLYSKQGKVLFPCFSDTGKGWSSVLGSWRADHWKAPLRARYKGDGAKIKHSLHGARIPSFFRSAIPVLEEKGEKKLLLPPAMEKSHIWEFRSGKITYHPSPLSSCLSQGKKASSMEAAID